MTQEQEREVIQIRPDAEQSALEADVPTKAEWTVESLAKLASSSTLLFAQRAADRQIGRTSSDRRAEDDLTLFSRD